MRRWVALPCDSADSQVIHELGSVLATMRAVARLHGAHTDDHGRSITDFDEDMKLSSVSTSRLLVFNAVQLGRLTIACALCYGGSFFIAHTIAFGDLILNCVALEVRQSSHARPPALMRARWRLRGRGALVRVVSSSSRSTIGSTRPSLRKG
jgi:hypothetical protein